MARKRLNMSIQKDIQKYKEQGKSQRKVAKLLGINKDTVNKYWSGALESGVEQIPTWVSEVDWKYVKNELKSTPKKIIYEELVESIKLPSYQAFCSYLRNNLSKKDTEIKIRIERTPGASIEVDYSGDSVQILNPATMEVHSVELFVGSLSCSGKIYAEFTYTQKLEDFIRSHVNMFTYFGGVCEYIIPDNCKTAVTKSDKYDPVINSTYKDMCDHYEIVVDPADPRKPRHKPNVENAVKYLQTDFLSRIRKKTFDSLRELNTELRIWLDKINNQIVQGRGKSRNFFFEKEKIFLKKLPSSPYELFYFKKAKVHPDCHLQHEKNYYSVPHQYVGKEVDIKFNENMIHIYCDCNRIATHKAMKGTYHWSTNYDHYPEKKYLEFNYHLGQLKKNSVLIGPHTSLLINKLMGRSNYPLKIIRKAQGILSLESTFGREALEYACEEALEFDRLNFDNVKRFAKNYKSRKVEEVVAPKRQPDLVCLQGGYCE